ncbi:unnamed protein product, partial [Meganyctiphanes norvegica]
EAAFELYQLRILSNLIVIPTMMTTRTAIVFFLIVLCLVPAMEARPRPEPSPMLFDMFAKVFEMAKAHARANDRGSGSFAMGDGCRIGGNALGPDPFAFPGKSPFPAAPLCI